MKLDFTISPDKAAAALTAASHIQQRLTEAIAARGRATLAISGGSTPRLMFAEFSRNAVDWKRVELFFVDERCVPPEHEDSNFRMVNEVLIDPLSLDPVHVHRIEGERDPSVAAEKYANRLLEVFGLRRSETPVFDIIHLGMGGDSHTASLFPGTAVTRDRERLTAASFVPKLQAWRVTLAPKVLLAAREVDFLVTGADKARALRGISDTPLDPFERPAQLLTEHPCVKWFVDEAALGT